MTAKEQYQWKMAMEHIKQMEHHKRIASFLIDGIIAKYYNEKDYKQEALDNTARAVNN